jgi:hypothetical protein
MLKIMVLVVRFRPWAPTKHLDGLANCFWFCADAYVRFARCNRFAPKHRHPGKNLERLGIGRFVEPLQHHVSERPRSS